MKDLYLAHYDICIDSLNSKKALFYLREYQIYVIDFIRTSNDFPFLSLQTLELIRYFHNYNKIHSKRKASACA